VSEQARLPLRPIEVLDVAQAPTHAGISAAHLDSPSPDALVDAATVRLTGWVVPASDPLVAVELISGDRLIGRAETGIHRPGVAERFGGPLAAAAGFQAAANLTAAGADAEVDLAVRAVLANGARPSLASVRLRRQPRAGDVRRQLVSVVIPCFDQAHYLGEAIESVLAQSHPDLELTVVDDGSDDNTGEVAARYPGVRRVRQAHRGVAAARNLGLTRSSGELVVFLDADDRLLSHALEVGVAKLAEHPDAAFAAGMPRDIAADGTVIRAGGQPVIADEHYLNLLRDCFIWSGSSLVYRRSALDAAGGFDERLEAADDYDLYLRLARRQPVVCHDAVVTEYRRHGSNATRNPALVLTSQLQVLDNQRPQLRNQRERAARRDGIRKTRAKQGQALADRLSAAWRSRHWRLAWQTARTLARTDPLRLLRLRRGAPRGEGARFGPLERDAVG
jgi:hypothetical protein